VSSDWFDPNVVTARSKKSKRSDAMSHIKRVTQTSTNEHHDEEFKIPQQTQKIPLRSHWNRFRFYHRNAEVTHVKWKQQASFVIPTNVEGNFSSMV